MLRLHIFIHLSVLLIGRQECRPYTQKLLRRDTLLRVRRRMLWIGEQLRLQRYGLHSRIAVIYLFTDVTHFPSPPAPLPIASLGEGSQSPSP